MTPEGKRSLKIFVCPWTQAVNQSQFSGFPHLAANQGPSNPLPCFCLNLGTPSIKLLERSRLTVEWFLRGENNRWLGLSMVYKHYSKDTHFRWKIKWRLEVLGAQRIMGETAPFMSSPKPISTKIPMSSQKTKP